MAKKADKASTALDYDLIGVARESHLKVTALRLTIRKLLAELRATEMDTITYYKEAGFTNHEIQSIMLIGMGKS